MTLVAGSVSALGASPRRCVFAVGGVAVAFEASTPLLLERLAALVESVCHARPTWNEPSFSVAVVSAPDENDKAAAPPGIERFRAGGVSAYRTPDGYDVVCGSSRVTLDIGANAARFNVHQSLWQSPLVDQRRLILVSLWIILHSHQRYGMHAGCVVGGNGGILIAGASGTGKSTLTLALVESGCSVLSDDSVLVSRQGYQVEAGAFRRGLSCGRKTADAFQIVLDAYERGEAVGSGKRRFNLEEVFPRSHVGSAVPNLILYPAIGSRARSSLAPVDPATSLFALTCHSPDVFDDMDSKKRQLSALTRLAHQASSYRIELGADVLEEPRSVAVLIAEAQAK